LTDDTQTTTAAPGEGSDFPQSWKFDEDGNSVTGTYLRMDEGTTSYGSKPIVVLDVDGEERSVWLSQTALRSKFADELARRHASDFDPGERISISRAKEKKTAASGHAYWPFTVIFHNAPKRDAASILGIDEDDATADDDGEDDGIPF